MKRFIKAISVHSILILILFVLSIIILGNIDSLRRNFLYYRIGSYGHMYTRLKDFDTIKNVDILFLGSSHSYRGFDPRIFKDSGYKIFNLGSSRQTPIQTEFLIENYLDSIQAKFVIIETFPLMFCDNGIESSLDIISNSKVSFKSLKLALKQNSLIVYNTLIYSLYRDVLLNEKEIFSEARQKENDVYIKGGFVEKEMAFFKVRDYNKQSWEFNMKQFEALADLVDRLKETGTKFIFIQAPLTSVLYNSYDNNDEFDHKISQFGLYHNFNDKIQLVDSLHFYDANHLNQEGVELFNQEIIRVLENELNSKIY